LFSFDDAPAAGESASIAMLAGRPSLPKLGSKQLPYSLPLLPFLSAFSPVLNLKGAQLWDTSLKAASLLCTVPTLAPRLLPELMPCVT